MVSLPDDEGANLDRRQIAVTDPLSLDVPCLCGESGEQSPGCVEFPQLQSCEVGKDTRHSTPKPDVTDVYERDDGVETMPGLYTTSIWRNSDRVECSDEP